jgi:hypothetical protein
MYNGDYAYIVISGNINTNDVVSLLERNFHPEYNYDCEDCKLVDDFGQTDKYFTIWANGQQVSAAIRGGNIITRTGLGFYPGQFIQQKAILNAQTLSFIGLEVEIDGSDELFDKIYQVLAAAFPHNLLIWSDE